MITTDAAPIAKGATPLFDVDVHWAEPPTLWVDRAPEKYKGKVFEVKEKSHGQQGWFVGDSQVAMIGPAVVRKDLGKQLETFTISRYEDMHPSVTEPGAALEYMNGAGIGAQVVYPNVIGFGGQALMSIFPDDADLRLWHVQTYNDAIVELQRAGGNRLVAQAALPLWDIDASIKELERVRKLGITGIAMSDKPADFGQPTLVDPKWNRFWEVAQETGTPINFHIGSGTFEGEVTKWWDKEQQVCVFEDGSLFGPLAIFMALNNFLNNQTTIMNLILTGHLERFPRLKYVSVESGAGWAPFLIQVMMFQWHEMMPKTDRAKFKRNPLEMFRDQIYCTAYCEEHWNVDQFVGYFGPDNLLFETDFPHPTSVYPHADSPFASALDYANSITRNLSAEDKSKVLYQNAEKLYGVSIAVA